MASDQSLHTTFKQLEHRRSTLSTLENDLPVINQHSSSSNLQNSNRAYSPSVFLRPKSNWVSLSSLAAD